MDLHLNFDWQAVDRFLARLANTIRDPLGERAAEAGRVAERVAPQTFLLFAIALLTATVALLSGNLNELFKVVEEPLRAPPNVLLVCVWLGVSALFYAAALQVLPPISRIGLTMFSLWLFADHILIALSDLADAGHAFAEGFKRAGGPEELFRREPAGNPASATNAFMTAAILISPAAVAVQIGGRPLYSAVRLSLKRTTATLARLPTVGPLLGRREVAVALEAFAWSGCLAWVTVGVVTYEPDADSLMCAGACILGMTAVADRLLLCLAYSFLGFLLLSHFAAPWAGEWLFFAWLSAAGASVPLWLARSARSLGKLSTRHFHRAMYELAAVLLSGVPTLFAVGVSVVISSEHGLKGSLVTVGALATLIGIAIWVYAKHSSRFFSVFPGLVLGTALLAQLHPQPTEIVGRLRRRADVAVVKVKGSADLFELRARSSAKESLMRHTESGSCVALRGVAVRKHVFFVHSVDTRNDCP